MRYILLNAGFTMTKFEKPVGAMPLNRNKNNICDAS